MHSHARYHVVEKTYHFKVQIIKPLSPFSRYYAAYYPYPFVYHVDSSRIARFIRHTMISLLFCATGGSIER